MLIVVIKFNSQMSVTKYITAISVHIWDYINQLLSAVDMSTQVLIVIKKKKLSFNLLKQNFHPVES